MLGRSMYPALLALGGCATLPPPALPAEARVAFDRDGITAASARGLADRATGRRATADDPVRVASISKLVVALGVMRLVEAGRVDLDRDVDTYLGWQVRNPAFPGEAVTLRMLLGHRSGLRDEVEYAVPLGRRLADTVGDGRGWDPKRRPGTYFRYANLGYPVVASVVERVTGERFDRAMARLVFAPLGVDACFNWTTCTDGTVARAVVLYDAAGAVVRDDLRGARPSCPVVAVGGCDLESRRPGENGALFSPQGGLRISARGLARIGGMLLRGGDGFLRSASIAAIEREGWRYDGANGETSGGFYCAYGMGVQRLATGAPGCRDDPFGRPLVGHAGEAYGVRSGLWLDRRRGTGVAFFATAVADGDRGRRSAFSRAEERLGR